MGRERDSRPIRVSCSCRAPSYEGHGDNRSTVPKETIISTQRQHEALPDTGSFEIIRTTEDRTGPEFHTVPIVLPHLDHAPVVIDTSWHGRHGISRFSAEVLRRVHVPRRFITSGASPASPADVVAAWRMRLGKDDVVFTPGFNAGVTRARQVLTLHDLIHLEDGDEGSMAKRVYYERLVRPAVRRAGTVLTVSKTSRTAIREWLRDDHVDVVNVGNGVSDLFFQPSAAQRSGRDLLYVGNLKPHKNPGPVFAALRLVPDARLTVVTSDVAGVEALGRQHGVEDRVRAVASCTDRELRDLYAASTALVIPSLREGFGLPAVEALAVGTPVIHWHGCDSVAEIVGSHGAAVDDAHDAEAWADAIGAALRGHVWSGRPEGWAEQWSWDGVARRIDRALRAVAVR
jgi:glycosyltransferase involved in cell wall biosynthesis